MSFFSFNTQIFKWYLKAKFKNNLASEHDFGSDQYKKLHQINRCFSSRPWGMQHDISGHVLHPFDIKTKTAYEFCIELQTFGDICMNTAQTISNTTDRIIAVFWSGGIDSTAALVALLQTIPRQQLVIICNQASIDEFPSFYEHKIKDRVKVISPRLYSQHYRDFFSVSGDGGDTVWGVLDDSFWQSSSHKINLPWQDCIDQNVMPDLDFVQEFCTWSGREIKSWLELRVWFYLCCKWQDKCMRLYQLRRGLSPEDAVPFYDIDRSFQNWTMNNLDIIIGDKWIDYKIPAKEFIFRYHKDADYLKYKSKVNSGYLDSDLVIQSNLQSYHRIAVNEDFVDFTLPSWPFIDYHEIEDFNDEYHLIPKRFLQ
jgi:hypothetical protein